MNIVTMIPYWNQYQYEHPDLTKRDITHLSGRILLNYPIELSNKVSLIQTTYIFTNDTEIKNLLDNRLQFICLPRDPSLDTQQTSIESVIRQFLMQVDADVVILLHPKSPFVTKESLQECIQKVVSGEHDSAFLARVEKKFAWYSGQRINYDVAQGTPHLSKIQSIVLETSSLYVFTRQCFEQTGTRIGNNPYVKRVGVLESIVISTPDDFKMAEYLLDSQFQLDL